MLKFEVLFIAFTFLFFAGCSDRDAAGNTGDTQNQQATKLIFQAGELAATNPDSALSTLERGMSLTVRRELPDTMWSNIWLIKGKIMYYKDSLEESIHFLRSAINKARDAGSGYHLASAHFEIAGSFLILTQHDSVIFHLGKAIELFDDYGFRIESANARINLGGVLVEKCQYKDAARYFVEADEILSTDNTENLALLSSLYTNIGNNFASIGSETESGYYGRKALIVAENARDTANIAIALTNLGVFYRYTRPDSALMCYLRAVELQRAAGYTRENRLSTLYNLGNIYLDQKNHDKANVLFDSVQIISESISMPKGVVMAISGKAAVASDRGQYALAAGLANRALNMADSLGFDELQLRFAQAKYYIDLKGGNKDAAIQSLETWMTLKDSMAVNNKISEVHAIERKYEIQRRDMEINRLLETRNWQERKVRDNRIIAVLALVVALVAFLFAYFYARLSKARREAYRQLIEKYEETSRRHATEMSILSQIPAKDQDSAAIMLVKKIHELFQAEKPYLDPGLKVDTLAEKLGVSYRTLNNAIKEMEGSTFGKLINRYRVEEVIQMFRMPEYDVIKTQAIAQQAGFGSVNAFYEAFQEITGVQPSHFRKILAEKREILSYESSDAAG